MSPSSSVLLTLFGPDAPGIAERLFTRLSTIDLPVLDVEQVQMRSRLLLCVELDGGPDDVRRVQLAVDDDEMLAALGLRASVSALRSGAEEVERPRSLVTLLGTRLDSPVLSGVFARLAGAGANVDRIVRLAHYPVTSYELTVSGGDPDRLRRDLSVEASRLGIDVAVQAEGLHRRAKHLIVLDADSTLLQGEVIDLLAARTGHAQTVAKITESAMAGQIDFAQALRQRVALLRGTDAVVLDEVRRALILAPGARTLVRTLRRLGYVTAVVSGGFLQVIEELAAELGIDHVAANMLEVRDGRLTGRLVGSIIDRPGKAEALVRFAAAAGVPLARTVAVGDGANDLDMLAVAGLGIAFNAKQVVRDAADTSLSVPYLDAILFLLGISRREIEAADEDDAEDACAR